MFYHLLNISEITIIRAFGAFEHAVQGIAAASQESPSSKYSDLCN
jgi:hypothetical protein